MDEAMVQAVTDRVAKLLCSRPRALLVGDPPAEEQQWCYVKEPPYEAVFIGSLTLGQLLAFRQEAVLEALSRGLPVYLWEPGLPEAGRNRALGARLAAARRELKALGVTFLRGGGKPGFVSASRARALRDQGLPPPPGAVLSPLARDILEGKAEDL